MAREKRKSERRSLKVQIRGDEGAGLGELFWEGTDLSMGGAFLASDLLLEAGDPLSLSFILPSPHRAVSVTAEVAWVRRFPKAGETAGMGVKFTQVSEADQKALDAFLSAS